MPQPEYVQRGYLREDFRLFHLKYDLCKSGKFFFCIL